MEGKQTNNKPICSKTCFCNSNLGLVEALKYSLKAKRMDKYAAKNTRFHHPSIQPPPGKQKRNVPIHAEYPTPLTKDI